MRSCRSSPTSPSWLRRLCSPSQPVPALFVIAAVTMLLLFIGIHNAWDVVTYTAFEHSEPQDNKPGK